MGFKNLEMGVSQNDGRMEGWLYLIRSNRIGLQYSRKRYFVLQDQLLQSFKSSPITKNEVYLLKNLLFLYCLRGVVASCLLDICILGVRRNDSVCSSQRWSGDSLNFKLSFSFPC